jgi:Tol biopolymer transport system component
MAVTFHSPLSFDRVRNMPNRCAAATAIVLAIAASAGHLPAAEAPSVIYVMRTDGSQLRKLARVEGYVNHASPRWSHDGKFVAFEAAPVDGGPRRCFVVAADGSNVREIGVGANPAWSPDDKQLAFHEQPAGGPPKVMVQNVDGEGRQEIGSGMSPRWSPDGSKLAVADGEMVRVIDLVTGEDIALFDAPYYELFHGFSWSPDGKSLAVGVREVEGQSRQLMLVSADGASAGISLRQKCALGGYICYSPDGQQMVYSANDRIQILDVAGNGAARILPGQVRKSRCPDWSPDGKWIVFESERDNAEAPPR